MLVRLPHQETVVTAGVTARVPRGQRLAHARRELLDRQRPLRSWFMAIGLWWILFEFAKILVLFFMTAAVFSPSKGLLIEVHPIGTAVQPDHELRIEADGRWLWDGTPSTAPEIAAVLAFEEDARTTASHIDIEIRVSPDAPYHRYAAAVELVRTVECRGGAPGGRAARFFVIRPDLQEPAPATVQLHLRTRPPCSVPRAATSSRRQEPPAE